MTRPLRGTGRPLLTAMSFASPAATPGGGMAGKAIVFAWLVEIVAVTMGLVLAGFAGIEGSDGGPVAILIAMMPFAALSIVELTKIPLVALAFKVSNPFWRLLAAAALLVVTGATFENFVFGFERGFNERIRAVEAAERRLADQKGGYALAQQRIPELHHAIDDLTGQIASTEAAIRGIRDQTQADINDAHADDTSAADNARRTQIEQQITALTTQENQAVAAERARCTVRDYHCHPSFVAAGFQRQISALNQQIADLDKQSAASRVKLEGREDTALALRQQKMATEEAQETKLETDLKAARADLAQAEQVVQSNGAALRDAQSALEARIEMSQLHRLSDVIYGNHERDNLERTKRIFVVSLAAIVALIGSVIAAMYYAAHSPANVARQRFWRALRGYLARRRRALSPVPATNGRTMDGRAGGGRARGGRDRSPLSRALRAYLARRRKRLVREVEVPVDRLKLVYLPTTASERVVESVRAEAAYEAEFLEQRRLRERAFAEARAQDETALAALRLKATQDAIAAIRQQTHTPLLANDARVAAAYVAALHGAGLTQPLSDLSDAQIAAATRDWMAGFEQRDTASPALPAEPDADESTAADVLPLASARARSSVPSGGKVIDHPGRNAEHGR